MLFILHKNKRSELRLTLDSIALLEGESDTTTVGVTNPEDMVINGGDEFAFKTESTDGEGDEAVAKVPIRSTDTPEEKEYPADDEPDYNTQVNNQIREDCLSTKLPFFELPTKNQHQQTILHLAKMKYEEK